MRMWLVLWREKEDDAETAEVEVIHRLGYDEVVNPERIVAIPGYSAG